MLEILLILVSLTLTSLSLLCCAWYLRKIYVELSIGFPSLFNLFSAQASLGRPVETRIVSTESHKVHKFSEPIVSNPIATNIPDGESNFTELGKLAECGRESLKDTVSALKGIKGG